MKTEKKNFRVRVYDNFHYADESEAYNYGEFENYEDALNAAKSIVDNFFEDNWKPGITIDELMTHYLFYGEDPAILASTNIGVEHFSARSYASISAAETLRKHETH